MRHPGQDDNITDTAQLVHQLSRDALVMTANRYNRLCLTSCTCCLYETQRSLNKSCVAAGYLCRDQYVKCRLPGLHFYRISLPQKIAVHTVQLQWTRQWRIQRDGSQCF